ncbi:PEP/pyruvate-binding domain-containing protein [Lysobacter firmicutimachus]|uniref:PEP/pyruvate-binding domain-containing protein n=1 Tax=Lysobacter firmicutimachus TaxID=1792846 RepID=A0AAU8MV36_9GAMM
MNAPAAVLDWSEAAAAGAAVAGGKGWQLGRMARLGIAVPSGFVIAAAASRDRAPGDPVDAALRARLAEELARRGWLERALAVRSSAPQEDSTQASFAGIHRSCLNVLGLDALARAVAEVWDSARTPAARAYRERFGLDGEDTAMAVVVMPLLPALASGVVFTRDPRSGREDRVAVNAHWGLGEALVGGQADVDEYLLHYDRIEQRVSPLQRRIGAKRHYTRARAEGGTELADTPAEQGAQAVLTPEQSQQVASLAMDAARALDFARPHYDVEWVWDGARVWIVQARPITAGARHTYPALRTQAALWTRGNTREILPEPLSAMDWSIYAVAADRMLTAGYELGGYPVLDGVPHAGLHHGRVYLEASLIQWEGYDAYGIAPAAINALIGGRLPEIAVPAPGWRDRLRRGARLLRYLRRSAARRRRAGRDVAAALACAKRWREQDLSQGDRALALRLREHTEQVRRADELFFLQGSAGGSLAGLVDLIEKYCPGEGQALAAALLAGGEPSTTARQGYELMALATTAAAEPTVLAWLRNGERDDAAWREALPQDSAFRSEFAAFLDRYGHRAVAESYLRRARWREQPRYLFEQILALLGSDAEALRRRQREAGASARQRLRGRLPAWQRPALNYLLRSAARDSNQREAARSALMAYFEALRRLALKLGERACERGALERAEDAFELDAEEWCALADGRLAPAHARMRALSRRELRGRQARQAEPELVVEHGSAPVLSPEPVRVAAGEGDWSGTPIGAGRARGRARIVRDPREGAALAAGEILVAPSTDPAWTPLFLRAAALVMETGGYLSHGAIVAREFGIPAVANLPGVLAGLVDGEEIEVDGDRGLVRRLRA